MSVGPTLRVAMFTTCLVDCVAPTVGKATWKLLRRLGVHVDVPAAQTCCGQMHVNTGYPDLAVPLVRNYVETFERYDAIVTPSGSCGASLRHQHAEIAERVGDHALAVRSREVTSKTYELSEFLVDVLGRCDVGAWFPHTVTYHPTCHSLRMLRVADKPLQLLRVVDSIDLIALPDAESCCGFGGTFSVKNSDVSAAILTDKLTAITETGASVCSAVDASCLLHIGGGLRRLGIGTSTLHLAEILASTRDDPWSAP